MVNSFHPLFSQKLHYRCWKGSETASDINLEYLLWWPSKFIKMGTKFSTFSIHKDTLQSLDQHNEQN